MYAVTMAASNLKVAAPDQFERLVEAFRQVEERYKADLIAAPASVIFNAQGHAWLAGQLRLRLEKCHEQRHAYESRA